MTKKSLFSILLVITTIVSATAQSSWNIIRTCTNVNLSAVDFIDSDHGIIVGEDGTMIITSDGGLSWKLLNSGIENQLNAVSYINEKKILVTGDNGLILITSDAGETWTSMKTGSEADLLSIDMLENGYGVIGGDSLTLLTTKDFGVTWLRISNKGEGRFRSVKIFDDTLAFAFGDNSRSNHSIYTINGLRNMINTREYQVFNDNNYSEGTISDGYPLTADSIIIVGIMYNYPDGGEMSYIANSETWVSDMWLPVFKSDSSFYSAVDMNRCYGIAVGAYVNENKKDNTGLISETYNQGKDWIEVQCPAGSAFLNDVELICNMAFIVGDEGLIMKREYDPYSHCVKKVVSKMSKGDTTCL